MFKNVIQASTVINNGGKQTLNTGDSVRFTDLPNQLVAIAVYNNNGNNGVFRIAYDGQRPVSRTMASVEPGVGGFGYIYFIDPSQTQSYDVSISVPTGAGEAEVSLDVYLISLMFPTDTSGVSNQPIALDGSPTRFKGYSRSYCTPQLAWYNVVVHADQGQGFMGLLFTGQNDVEVWGVNMPNGEAFYKNYVENGPGATSLTPTFHISSGASESNTIYGMAQQVVFAPISTAVNTQLGTISIQQA